MVLLVVVDVGETPSQLRCVAWGKGPPSLDISREEGLLLGVLVEDALEEGAATDWHIKVAFWSVQ